MNKLKNLNLQNMDGPSAPKIKDIHWICKIPCEYSALIYSGFKFASIGIR